jgi:DNA-binding LytR/AlgR family response regulator
MNALIIEDEKLSAEHLSGMLKRIDPEIRILEVIDSVKRSLEALKQERKIDLLFVDIHLADGLSFDIFSKLVIDTPVIFTTAYDEYAIKAFKLNSVDYLLKPIGLEDLKRALDKYKKFSRSSQSLLLENIAQAYRNIGKSYKNRFMVKTGDTIVSVKTEDVVHFIAEDGIVLLVTNTGKRYAVDYALEQLEGLIPPESFFRINRKVLIHINTIQKVSSYFNSRLKLVTERLAGEDCVVSRERVNDFKLWLDK